MPSSTSEQLLSDEELEAFLAELEATSLQPQNQSTPKEKDLDALIEQLLLLKESEKPKSNPLLVLGLSFISLLLVVQSFILFAFYRETKLLNHTILTLKEEVVRIDERLKELQLFLIEETPPPQEEIIEPLEPPSMDPLSAPLHVPS